MLRTITKDITNVANTEVIKDYFTTPKGKRRTVKYITAEYQTDLFIRAYLDQDRIVEIGLECDTITQGFSPDLNIDVPQGSSFKAGFYDLGGNTATAQLTVWYEETTA